VRSTSRSSVTPFASVCYARQVAVVHKLLDGNEEAVRRWFAVGMLADVTTMLGLGDIDEPWARTLSDP
jgi:hypothetical protein